MATFEPAYRFGGGAIEAQELWISSGTTTLKRGAFVTFYSSCGVCNSTGAAFDDAVIGVSAEPHDGVTTDNGVTGRQIGDKVLVYTDPNLVFKITPAKTFISTGGSTATIEVASLNSISTGFYIDSYLLPYTIGTSAPSGYSTGKALKITDSTTSGKLTFSGLSTGTWANSSDSVWLLYPGKRTVSYYGWDLTTDSNEINFESTGALNMIVVGTEWDEAHQKGSVLVKPRVHQFGNLPIAS